MPTTLTGPDVRAWPSLSRAARALGVDKSTLSRRDDLHGERVGQQEIRLSPATVMRLAREYRRRVVDEVAFALVEYAREHAEDQLDAVEAEIDAYLAGHPSTPPDVAELLELARRPLPVDPYRQGEGAPIGAKGRGGPESIELFGLVDRGTAGSESELAAPAKVGPKLVEAGLQHWHARSTDRCG